MRGKPMFIPRSKDAMLDYVVRQFYFRDEDNDTWVYKRLMPYGIGGVFEKAVEVSNSEVLSKLFLDTGDEMFLVWNYYGTFDKYTLRPQMSMRMLFLLPHRYHFRAVRIDIDYDGTKEGEERVTRLLYKASMKYPAEDSDWLYLPYDIKYNALKKEMEVLE